MVEWRALTVALLGEVLAELRKTNGNDKLTMSQLLQTVTWPLGRELAFKRDPKGHPPVKLGGEDVSGTVF